jgi:DNA-binding MarR family transcriptional regulator
MHERAASLAAAAESLTVVTRMLVGAVARSIPEAAEVTLPQWRALVVLDASGEMNVNALAEHLGIEPSSCTRLCDRLVTKDLIEREFSRDRRREVLLRLSPKGSTLVSEAVTRRRAEIERMLGPLSPSQLRRLAGALRPLIAAATEAPDDAWALGWVSRRDDLRAGRATSSKTRRREEGPLAPASAAGPPKR